MEERTQTFDEKLELLLEEAKKKKNVLENREILDFFKGEILDPEKLDRIYDFLDNHHVDVLRKRKMTSTQNCFWMKIPRKRKKQSLSSWIFPYRKVWVWKIRSVCT